ncbi:hypothetical protein DFH09DRAFT_1332079 [Mycena vulgaris]|nr:hypothetical protein DFH09DRAFT_1332079 [Mycena vulgaris]
MSAPVLHRHIFALAWDVVQYAGPGLRFTASKPTCLACPQLVLYIEHDLLLVLGHLQVGADEPIYTFAIAFLRVPAIQELLYALAYTVSASLLSISFRSRAISDPRRALSLALDPKFRTFRSAMRGSAVAGVACALALAVSVWQRARLQAFTPSSHPLFARFRHRTPTSPSHIGHNSHWQAGGSAHSPSEFDWSSASHSSYTSYKLQQQLILQRYQQRQQPERAEQEDSES